MDERTFLLVEDSAVDAWLVSRALRVVPRTSLRLVKNARQAIDYLEGYGRWADRKAFPLPHVILLDWDGPAGSGLKFMAWRRQAATPDLVRIPAVVLADSEQEEDVLQAYAWGADQYLVKTSDLALFDLRIRVMAEIWAGKNPPKRSADPNTAAFQLLRERPATLPLSRPPRLPSAQHSPRPSRH